MTIRFTVTGSVTPACFNNSFAFATSRAGGVTSLEYIGLAGGIACAVGV